MQDCSRQQLSKHVARQELVTQWPCSPTASHFMLHRQDSVAMCQQHSVLELQMTAKHELPNSSWLQGTRRMIKQRSHQPGEGGTGCTVAAVRPDLSSLPSCTGVAGACPGVWEVKPSRSSPSGRLHAAAWLLVASCLASPPAHTSSRIKPAGTDKVHLHVLRRLYL